MVNWKSLFSLMSRAPNLLTDTNGHLYHYDWELGVYQYSFGLLIVLIGLTALEGSSLSLLSKCSPVHARSIFVHVGTIATFVGLVARSLGDFQIVMVDLSHKLINTDIVNALVVPLLFGTLVIAYVVNKHFFFLM